MHWAGSDNKRGTKQLHTGSTLSSALVVAGLAHDRYSLLAACLH